MLGGDEPEPGAPVVDHVAARRDMLMMGRRKKTCALPGCRRAARTAWARHLGNEVGLHRVDIIVQQNLDHLLEAGRRIRTHDITHV
jgi:hypothetical protein